MTPVKKILKKSVFICLLLILINSCAATALANNLHEDLKSKEAIVLGKIIKKQIIKLNNYYITEYKLKIKKWIYKKPYIANSKTVTIRVLGADLPDKGITIKASTSPDYVPFNTDTIFILNKTKQKYKDIFTLSKNSIFNPDEEKHITYLLQGIHGRNLWRHNGKK